jgi:hypothetical protein
LAARSDDGILLALMVPIFCRIYSTSKSMPGLLEQMPSSANVVPRICEATDVTSRHQNHQTKKRPRNLLRTL